MVWTEEGQVVPGIAQNVYYGTELIETRSPSARRLYIAPSTQERDGLSLSKVLWKIQKYLSKNNNHVRQPGLRSEKN